MDSCPACGSNRVFRSKTRTAFERFRRQFTLKRPYRCHSCNWRGWAPDGMQAVALVRRERPDLVLLDIGLPGGDGFSVIQRIKSMSQNAALPVIVMSARDASENRERMLAAGAEAYIQKPADNQVLLASIRYALGEGMEERKAG